jgi:hypothetical protein
VLPGPVFAYHVLNRAVGRARLFRSGKDYAAFQAALLEARQRLGTPERHCLLGV